MNLLNHSPENADTRRKRPSVCCIHLWICVTCTCFSTTASADIKPSRLFSDHVVLQRDKPVSVWGTAEPGETVAVAIGDDQATVTTDAEGGWVATLPQRPASSEAVDIKISGKNNLVIHDVLFGDVWLASGQSNMEMAFFWTEKGKEVAKTINTPLIRMFRTQEIPKDTPQISLSRGGWTVCSAGAVLNHSQLGYYFAHELQEKLGIPIGVICSASSGTSITPWMSAEALVADPAGATILERWQKVLSDYPEKVAAFEKAKSAWEAEKAVAKKQGTPFKRQCPLPPSGPGSPQTPSGLYNSMIHPLVPLALRGVIWYQGESNTKTSRAYRSLFPSLIQSWRKAFSCSNLPFYWVQLPNYNMGTEYGDDWAGVREAQALALALPDTGMAVTLDIGDGSNVHPNNKAEVGRRLARVALSGTYGDKSVVASGPFFDHAVFNDTNSVQIFFKPSVSALTIAKGATDDAISGFALAGEDRHFHPASAHLDRETGTVLVSSKAVAHPVAIRYAWSNNPTGLTLVNTAGLPLAPFRTDDW